MASLNESIKPRLTNPKYSNVKGSNPDQWQVAIILEVIGKTGVEGIVVSVEPEAMNERLASQQGLFPVAFQVSKGFMESLSEMFNQPSNTWASPVTKAPPAVDYLCTTVLKIVIPTACHNEVIRHLKRMNITSLSLFPGLDGFARSFEFHLCPG